MPEFQNRPFLQLRFDTVVTRFNLITPGDSVEYLPVWSSHTEANTVEIGSFRENQQPVLFSGPDSALNRRIFRAFPGKNPIGIRTGFRIPNGIKPGLHRFYARVRNAAGGISDSGSFRLFIDNFDYPGLVLDTPLAGFAAQNRVSSRFRLQIRAFGTRMDRLELRWFDSLRTGQLGEALVQSAVNPDGISPFREMLDLPATKGRQYFLEARMFTREERMTRYWISLLRVP